VAQESFFFGIILSKMAESVSAIAYLLSSSTALYNAQCALEGREETHEVPVGALKAVKRSLSQAASLLEKVLHPLPNHAF
jgi:hypothetical protein